VTVTKRELNETDGRKYVPRFTSNRTKCKTFLVSRILEKVIHVHSPFHHSSSNLIRKLVNAINQSLIKELLTTKLKCALRKFVELYNLVSNKEVSLWFGFIYTMDTKVLSIEFVVILKEHETCYFHPHKCPFGSFPKPKTIKQTIILLNSTMKIFQFNDLSISPFISI
jgi:hypothetical protein